jgi:hypothetical protein
MATTSNGRPQRHARHGVPRQYEFLWRLETAWLREPKLGLNEFLLKLGGGRRVSDETLLRRLRRLPDDTEPG